MLKEKIPCDLCDKYCNCDLNINLLVCCSCLEHNLGKFCEYIHVNISTCVTYLLHVLTVVLIVHFA